MLVSLKMRAKRLLAKGYHFRTPFYAKQRRIRSFRNMHASPPRATPQLSTREVVELLIVRNNLSGSPDLEQNDLSIFAGTHDESVLDVSRRHTILNVGAGDDILVSHLTVNVLAIPDMNNRRLWRTLLT